MVEKRGGVEWVAVYGGLCFYVVYLDLGETGWWVEWDCFNPGKHFVLQLCLYEKCYVNKV